MTDWGIVAEALTTSKTLETVTCILFGKRGEGWARALDAGVCADTPLSSVHLTIWGPMSKTGLQAVENVLLNKSLSSVSVIVKGEMSHSLAVTLSRALAGQTPLKVLELRVNGKLSCCCANSIERGIVKNNSLSNLVCRLHGELPDNWQAIVENLNVRLAEKSTLTFEIYPNIFNQVTATQLTDFRPCVRKYGLFEQESVTLNVWGELTVYGAEDIYNLLPFDARVSHLTLNIHGKFLLCTARHVDKQKPITINTWDQLTNEGKALFRNLKLCKKPAVTLNVCDVYAPSDESGDDKIVSIDNPASLIALLEEAKNTGEENLTVTIDVQSDYSTFDDSWNRSLLLGLPRNCSLNSLTLTFNNFGPMNTELSLTLISFLESCISLKSLNLTINEYHCWKDTYGFLLLEFQGRNTSQISLTLTLNIYTRALNHSDCDFDYILYDDDFVPDISLDSFTLTISDFSNQSVSDWDRVDIMNSDRGLELSDLWWPNSLDTFNLILNNWDEVNVFSLLQFFDSVMKVNSLRTLRLKIIDSPLECDFSKLVVKSPSLEFIELTICRYGDVGSCLETLKWEKQ